MEDTSSQKWSVKELSDLYTLKKHEGKPIKEIAKILGKTQNAIEKKLKRTDWDDFHEDPEAYVKGEVVKLWSHSEMCQLYAYLQAKQSYRFIAEKLNRSISSVEKKAQKTNWPAWELAVGSDKDNPQPLVHDEALVEQLVEACLALSRHDPVRLKTLNAAELCRKINFNEDDLPISFEDIRKKSSEQMDIMGLGNPETVSLKEGTYVVFGDSHGKFTRTKMFDLIDQVNIHIKPDKFIHIGHLLDDDNEISFNWGRLDNLIVLAKKEELSSVQNRRHQHNFSFEIARGAINLGNDLVVINQDLIGDYVKTPISSVDQEIFDSKVVTNSHRLELASKCTDGEPSYFVTPGGLCERHIVKTIKQINFEDNRVVKQAYHDGFSKYRRMEHMFKFWRHGMIVVNVDSKGDHTVIPCQIRQIKGEYVTSYFNKIITSSGLKKPDKTIFVHADSHSPNHDSATLDIQEQVCKDYNAEVLVHMGDANDYRSLNHHDMDRGIPTKGKVLAESAATYHVLNRMSKWAKEKHIIVGNHERFSTDFVNKNPQFSDILDLGFLCGLGDLEFKVTPLKDVLKIGSTKFIHGDMVMFGQSGNKLEKSSRTFGDNIFIGHIHFPGIRFGCCSIGCACKLDQGYNEPNASTWVHGYGLCNQYQGQSFPTTIPIVNNKCIINGKTYTPINQKSWDMSKYKAKIV